MKEDEIIMQLQKVNSEFYHAFENLSIERMEVLFAYTQVGTYLLVG
jgi:hypothetical protein